MLLGLIRLEIYLHRLLTNCSPATVPHCNTGRSVTHPINLSAELVRAATMGVSAHQKQKRPFEWRQQPPSELVFANQTGAIVQCGVALELAKSIAKAELAANSKPTTTTTTMADTNNNGEHELPEQHQHSPFGGSGGFQSSSPGYLATNQRLPTDIQIRWEKENGDEVEHMLYAQQSADVNGEPAAGANSNNLQNRPLRFQRASDGALVFEPFKPADFRPDVHATTYRCSASSSTKGASVVSGDMRARALLTSPASQLQVEVLDQLVVEGGSVAFRCQIPSHAQDYLQVLDWIELPGELVHSFPSTTLKNADHLFHPSRDLAEQKQQQQQHVQHKRQQQTFNGDHKSQPQNKSMSKYFVAPKSGDLHIVNVDSSLNYRSFKCRCKNKLTGELVSSINKGKLIVSGEFCCK